MMDVYRFFRGRWVPIPYVYNALKTLKTAHTDIWNDDDVRNVHYMYALAFHPSSPVVLSL
jgi:hypothetical protein